MSGRSSRMSQRFDERCAHETASSEDLVRAFRNMLQRQAEVGEEMEEGHEEWRSLGVVHYRGGQEEFELGRRCAVSADPLDRKTGAVVLAQLGWNDRTFLDETVAVLLPMLRDSELDVVIAAAYALGHRNDPRAIPHVVPLVGHPEARVRRAVVSALSQHDDDAAIAGLIRLAADGDDDVRNWAAFGLGTLLDRDTPEIREALAALLPDEDAEIRGEAMIGLAKRQDPRALGAVAADLSARTAHPPT